VLVFNNDGAVRSLPRGKLTLNAEASAAAGPVARKTQAGVEIPMTLRRLSYRRSKGALAGVSVAGAVITIGHRQ